MIRRPKLVLFACAPLCACLLAAPAAFAVELLSDPSFEDSLDIEEEGALWEWVYGFLPQPSVNQTSDPLSGSQHAELQLDTSQLFTAFGPTIRSTAYAGSGAAESIEDFTGETLTVSSHYKVTALNMSSPDPELPPSVVIRTYLAYFSEEFGFLGFGGIEGNPFFSDVYPETVSTEYLTTAYSVTVPDFGTPVTSVDFTFGLIAPSTDGGQQMTGTATVIFDDVSLALELPVSADFNGDGVVDAVDYTVWRNTLGMTELEPFALGDADGNGTVNTLDYDIWKSQYGDIIVGAGIGAIAYGVPEPSAVSICLLMIGLTFGGRLNRSSRT